MNKGLIIKVVDLDEDYLGIEIYASNARSAGATRIYAGFGDLSELASLLAGFPKKVPDERSYEFGHREQGIAGGYSSLRFHTTDKFGHAALEIELEDDDQFYEPAMTKMRFKIEAADIDRFVQQLRNLDKNKSGEATLPMRSNLPLEPIR